MALSQSNLGTIINLVALTLYVYDRTQSGAAVGTLQMVMVVPSVIVGLFAGIVVDRCDKKWVMVIADLVRAVLFFGIALLPSIPLIYAVVFASSLTGLFFAPAYLSSLPLLIEKKHLMEANSLSEVTSQIAQIIGPGLAGFIYVQWGFGLICALNAASFVISAALVMTVDIPSNGTEQPRWFSLKRTMGHIIEGFQYIRSNGVARWVTLAVGGLHLGGGAIVVLMVMFVKDILHGSSAAYGMIVSATAVGSVCGAVATWFRRGLKESTVLKSSFLVLGVAALFLSLSSAIWLALLLFAVVGLAQTTIGISIDTLLQQHLPAATMGRTFATIGVITQVCRLVSMGAGGIAADVVGIRTVFILGSSIMLSTALIVLRSGSVQTMVWGDKK
ncbi:MAG: MFS transporter [candidate division Zixibacteria bacterium]|nr:MFS transporter [candidate division Zixibacteria bacterium]